MARGDHISVSRGIYNHHAIDLGNGTVIQYGAGIGDGNPKIEIVPFNVFSKGGRWKVERSVCGDNCEKIVNRALARLGEQKYSILFNNCEHFANWCHTGEKTSKQADTLKRCIRFFGKEARKQWRKKS